jgi:PleD family two-component response regulator
LQFSPLYSTLLSMSNPLALLYYSNLMPGSQLSGRLQDLGYRVQTVSTASQLATACDTEMPLVVIAELAPITAACAAISQLRTNAATQHIPVLGFARAHDASVQSQAREAGVTLLAADAGIAEQLPRLLDQILQVE